MAAVKLIVMQNRVAMNQCLSQHDAIADKIETHPELLEIPLANIERWLAQGHSAPHRLEQWRKIILEAKGGNEGMRRLLSILRDKAEEATHLRSFAPFPGILTREERRELLCSHQH